MRLPALFLLGAYVMPNLAVIGAQWGDEGKGKVVDLLAPHFSVVARYQGGPNAGHTVVFGGKSHALHHIPSGIFRDGVRNLVGAGTLVDPDALLGELAKLRDEGVPVESRLLLSARAHVIMPFHRDLDAALEGRLAGAAIGTTKRGIGPAYSAKSQRWGVRLADLETPDDVAARVEQALGAGLAQQLQALRAAAPDPRESARLAERWWAELGPLVGDVTEELHQAIADRRSILFEGAQGTMLDIDHGTYPFVTSSSTIAGGIPASLGVPPRAVETVVGVAKAYATRVGAGPFPTEDKGATGDQLREAGREYGTTTGRPRRCGWFDAVAMRYAVRVNGLDAITLTKFDVLTGLPTVKIATAYEIDGGRTTSVPPTVRAYDRVRPVYEELPGWSESLDGVRSLADLPRNARAYLARLEELSECPVGLLSVGADRAATVIPAGSVLERWSK